MLLYRLRRDDMAKVWGGSYRKGEKSVATSDKDSITMAVEAVICEPVSERQFPD